MWDDVDLIGPIKPRYYEPTVEKIAWGDFCLWPMPRGADRQKNHNPSYDYIQRRKTKGVDYLSLTFNTGKSGAIKQLVFEGCRKAIRFEE